MFKKILLVIRRIFSPKKYHLYKVIENPDWKKEFNLIERKYIIIKSYFGIFWTKVYQEHYSSVGGILFKRPLAFDDKEYASSYIEDVLKFRERVMNSWYPNHK